MTTKKISTIITFILLLLISVSFYLYNQTKQLTDNIQFQINSFNQMLPPQIKSQHQFYQGVFSSYGIYELKAPNSQPHSFIVNYQVSHPITSLFSKTINIKGQATISSPLLKNIHFDGAPNEILNFSGTVNSDQTFNFQGIINGIKVKSNNQIETAHFSPAKFSLTSLNQQIHFESNHPSIKLLSASNTSIEQLKIIRTFHTSQPELGLLTININQISNPFGKLDNLKFSSSAEIKNQKLNAKTEIDLRNLTVMNEDNISLNLTSSAKDFNLTLLDFYKPYLGLDPNTKPEQFESVLKTKLRKIVQEGFTLNIDNLSFKNKNHDLKLNTSFIVKPIYNEQEISLLKQSEIYMSLAAVSPYIKSIRAFIPQDLLATVSPTEENLFLNTSFINQELLINNQVYDGHIKSDIISILNKFDSFLSIPQSN